MDPDLVRQQEEAEREAMRLAGQKLGSPAPLAIAATLQTIAASATQGPKPILPGDARPASYHAQRAGLGSDEQSLAGAIGPSLPQGQPQPRRDTARSALGYFSEFLSFALAGAMLGGGLGIAAANYMQLPVEAAKLVIFGPAGFFAIACALASFFPVRTAQPRASNGM
jgi:hypothetical protein